MPRLLRAQVAGQQTDLIDLDFSSKGLLIGPQGDVGV